MFPQMTVAATAGRGVKEFPMDRCIFALLEWAALLLACPFLAPAADHDAIAGRAAIDIIDVEHSKTIVTPTLDCAISPGTNVLWCATMQLAWDQLCNLAGGPVELTPHAALCDALNKSPFNTNNLCPGSYVAVAGFGQPALARIQAEFHSRFGDAARPTSLPATLGEKDWIAYSYLFQHLPFKTAFTRFSYPLPFAGKDTAWFGIHQYFAFQGYKRKMAEQVRVYDYRDSTNFVAELLPANSSNRIILAMLPQADNLNALVREARARVANSRPTTMVESSTLGVPVVDFNLVKDYTQLRHRRIAGTSPKLNGTMVEIARQAIRFRLDEQGAVLKSDSLVASCISQDLVFDKPFLLMLQQRNAGAPYLALWISNAELLAPYATPPLLAATEALAKQMALEYLQETDPGKLTDKDVAFAKVVEDRANSRWTLTCVLSATNTPLQGRTLRLRVDKATGTTTPLPLQP
jgi:hypothetical protein